MMTLVVSFKKIMKLFYFNTEAHIYIYAAM